MTWTRRQLLETAGAMGLVVALPGLTACRDPGPDYVYDGPSAGRDLFVHAVASGDPLADSVVLWTKVELGDATSLEAYVEVYDDPTLSRRVAARFLDATADRNGCIKVVLDGLRPGRTWYYRFRCLDRTSPVGRTRTAPETGPDRLRLALTSCSNYTWGWFHAYRAIAERDDLDLVLHAGDYIYESGYRVYREHEPSHEIVSLDDYRTRYSQYRRDPDLQELHRQHPMVATWDDHESANNSWADGADAHDPSSEGTWSDRLSSARTAWFEWLPAREGPEGELYRSVMWGDLAEILVLDSRIAGREEATAATPEVLDEDRQMLGEAQEDWLFARLRDGEARWRILLQQVVMTPWVGDDSPPLNPDQWDGYPAARRRLLEVVRDHALGSTVVLTGDIHSSWANDIPLSIDDYDELDHSGSVAVEAVTPAVTSPGAGSDLGPALDVVSELRPSIRWVDGSLRGFVVLDVTAARVVAQWWHFEDGDTEQETFRAPYLAKTFLVDHGATAWVASDDGLPEREDLPDPAPAS